MENPIFRRGVPGLIPDAWIVNPNVTTAEPPVVVVHGIKRQTDSMAHLLRRRAAEVGRIIVLPHFDVLHWKHYQRAACANRSDIGLLSLMQVLTDERRIAPGRFDLAGFSGGAQFSHRFAWMYPHAVGRLCLTAPGWWTFPDPKTAWPYGIGSAHKTRGVAGHWLQANLRRFLDREIVVRVGTEDTSRDANLRAGPEIDAQQGLTRVDRARNWTRAMQRAAHAAGVRPNISFDTLEGCGHSFSACVVQAQLDRLFVPPTHPCAGCRNVGICTNSLTLEPLERSAA